MKTQNAKTINGRSFLVAVATVGMLLFSFTMQSFGQKEPAEPKRATTRDGLPDAGYLTKAEILDEFDGNEDEYFYQFKAVPGKLTVTVEVTANETNAGVMVDVFGPNSKAILSNILVQAANRGTDRAMQSANLIKAQDVVIRIKGLKYGSSAGYPGVYKLLLEGPAVKFNAPPAEGQGGEVEAPILPATGGKIPQNSQPDAPPSDVAGQGDKPADAAPAGTSPTKKPDAVDKTVEKGKSKTKEVLDILKKVYEKIPD